MNPTIDLSEINVPTRTHIPLLTSTDDPHIFELNMDNSGIEDCQNCWRKGFYHLVCGRTSAGRDALDYGTAMHKAMDAYYRDGASFEQIAKILDRHFREFPPSENSWRNFDHALEAMRRFMKKRSEMPIWDILEVDGKKFVERGFKLPFVEIDGPLIINLPLHLVTDKRSISDSPSFAIQKLKVNWTGRIDLALKRDKGAVPLDHKTTSMYGNDYSRQHQLASQFRGYSWALQKLIGQPVNEYMINVLVGRAPTKSGTAHEFHDLYFDIDQESIDEWESDMKGHLSTLLSHLATGYFPKSTTHCSNKYGICAFHDVCRQPKSIRPQILMSGQYAENTWNPLHQT